MSEWTKVGKSSEVVPEAPFAASARGAEVVLLRTKDGLRAFEGRCPHRGALLGEGEIDGASLVCRNHQWRFDVTTGKREGGPHCLRACPVREADGHVEIDVTSLLTSGPLAKTKRRLEDLPGPPGLPLIGSAHLVSPSHLHLKLEAWAREYGTPFTYRFGPMRVLVLANMEDMTPAFRERPGVFRRTSNLESIFDELGLAGVFSAEGEAWRPQRRLSMGALSQRHLREFYPTLKRVAERLRKRFLRLAREGAVLDIADELKRFTVDVTTLLVFGYDIDTLGKDEDVIQRKLELMFPALNRRLFSIVPWWRFLPIPVERRADRANREIQAWLKELLDQSKARIAAAATGSPPENFLEAMIVARDDAGRPFDDPTILGNAMTMLLAGEDTTAYSLAWAIHHLADAPNEVEAFRTDLRATLGEDPVPADMDTAQRLAYAGAVANEAMRLRPVAPLLFMEALVDTTLADLAVPKGTTVLLLVRPPATDSENFFDPEAFKPSRWLGAPQGAHEPAAHQPFGSGPRVCPGRSLALLEMKVVLGTIFQSFHVERVGKSEDVGELFAFTMMPTGLRVRLRERAPQSIL